MAGKTDLVSVVMGLVKPIVRRVLLALGIGYLTYSGLDYVLSGLTNAIINSLGGMAGSAAQLAAILGFQKSIGILLGAVTTRLSLTTMTRLGKT